MNQDGSLNNLAGRMREKIRKEQVQTEEAVANSLKTLSKNLQELSQKEANIIHSGMAKNVKIMTERLNQESRLLNWTFVKAWVRTALIGIALSIGMCIGLWLAVDWLADEVSSNMYKLSSLKTEIRLQRETLQTLQEKTFGIDLMKDKDGKFIVLPDGAVMRTGWTIGKRELIKLE